MYHHFLRNNGHCYDFCCTGISGPLMSDASLTHISSSLMIQKPTNGILTEHVVYCRSKWATTQTTPAWLGIRKQLNTCLNFIYLFDFFVAFYFAFLFFLKHRTGVLPEEKLWSRGYSTQGITLFVLDLPFHSSLPDSTHPRTHTHTHTPVWARRHPLRTHVCKFLMFPSKL